jgi:hypothetical protein
MNRFVLLASLLISTVSLAAAKTSISLCVGDWDGYSTADLKGGAYIELMNTVFGEQYDLKWARYSFVRCQSDFKAGKFDVLVGENKSDSSLKGSAQFDAAYLIAVYSQKKYPKWDESKHLGSGTFSWIRGYGFEKLVPGAKSFTEVNSLNQALRQLLAGRFDIYLDDDIDEINKAMSSPEFKGKGLKVTETKVKEVMVLIFKDMPEAKNLIKLSDAKINSMRKDGRIKSIFEKYELTYIE